MTKYAKVNKNSGIVVSVEDYDPAQAPQAAAHEEATIEYVEVEEGQEVQVGHPLPDEARAQGEQGHQGDPGHQGQGGGQAQAPGQQPGAGGGPRAQPKK